MLKYLAFTLVFALTGCKEDAAGDAGIPDLSMHNQLDGGSDEDMSAIDAGNEDQAKPPDLDNHQALKIPGDAVPLKQDGGVDYYEMHVKEGMAQVLPGPMTPIWGFDGQWPGKTVHATLGRPVTIRVFNDLPVAE